MGKAKGFTLIELVAVLVIAGLLFAIAAPNFSRLAENSDYRRAVREVMTAAQQARRSSIYRNVPVDLVFEAPERKMAVIEAGASLDSANFVELPRTLELTVTSAAEVSPASGFSAIRFYPAGGASGGEVDLVRPSGDGTRIQVGWLLADVSQGALQ